MQTLRQLALLAARRGKLALGSAERFALRQGMVAAMGVRDGDAWPPIGLPPRDDQETTGSLPIKK